MAQPVVYGTFTAETVNGNDTVISGLTDPKGIFMWTAKDTAAGATDTHGEFYFGGFSYEGAAVQQFYHGFADEDAALTSNTAKGMSTTACLKGFDTFTSPNVEFELRGVSMDSTSITMDWFNAANSAYIIHYLVFQGSGVKCFCGGFAGTVAVATQDVTINTGFGKADILISCSNATTSQGDSAGARNSLGFAAVDGTKFCGGIWSADGSANMSCSSFLKADAFASQASVSGFDGEATWDQANDPTDGFRLSWVNQLAAAHRYCFMAIQGVTATCGLSAAPTAGSPPVVQDNAAGFNPCAGLVMCESLAAHTNVDSTSADVFGFSLGAFDANGEGGIAIVQDDGNGTSFAGRVTSTDKTAFNYLSPGAAGAPTLQSEADGSANGTNLRLSWNDIDSVARAYGWIAFEEAAAAAPASLVWAAPPPSTAYLR